MGAKRALPLPLVRLRLEDLRADSPVPAFAEEHCHMDAGDLPDSPTLLSDAVGERPGHECHPPARVEVALG